MDESINRMLKILLKAEQDSTEKEGITLTEEQFKTIERNLKSLKWLLYRSMSVVTEAISTLTETDEVNEYEE